MRAHAQRALQQAKTKPASGSGTQRRRRPRLAFVGRRALFASERAHPRRLCVYRIMYAVLSCLYVCWWTQKNAPHVCDCRTAALEFGRRHLALCVRACVYVIWMFARWGCCLYACVRVCVKVLCGCRLSGRLSRNLKSEVVSRGPPKLCVGFRVFAQVYWPHDMSSTHECTIAIHSVLRVRLESDYWVDRASRPEAASDLARQTLYIYAPR